MNIAEDQIQIIRKEVCDIRGGFRAEHIDMTRVDDRVNGLFEILTRDLIDGAADLVDVLIQNAPDDVGITDTTGGHLDALDGIQLVADHFLHRLLQIRKAVITDLGREAHDRTFGNADLLA